MEFFIETSERIVFRRTSVQEIETRCETCGTTSIFIQPERAALLFNLTTREIYRGIERGTIDFFESETGATLVCAASLSRQAQTVNLDLQPIGEIYEEPK